MSLINDALNRAQEEGQPLELVVTPTLPAGAAASPLPSAKPMEALPVPPSARSTPADAQVCTQIAAPHSADGPQINPGRWQRLTAAALSLLVLGGAYYIWRVEQGGPVRTLALQQPLQHNPAASLPPTDHSVTPTPLLAEPAPIETVAVTPAVPAATPQPAGAAQTQFKLSGILHSNEGPVAIINGESLKPGESLDDGILLKVTSSSAEILCHDGRRITLRL